MQRLSSPPCSRSLGSPRSLRRADSGGCPGEHRRGSLVVTPSLRHAVEPPLRGTAEGLVSGERRSLELEIKAASEPGVFRIARQWPAEGRWVLVLNVTGERGVSTLVTLEPGASLKIADQKQSFDKPQPERIAAALGTPAPAAR